MSPRLLALEGLQNVEQIRPVLQRLCPTMVPGFGKIIHDADLVILVPVRNGEQRRLSNYENCTVYNLITITIVDNN